MTKPKRPPIPLQLQKTVKAKNLGVCCVCKERGLGINLHHIDGDPFNNVEQNIAVLCVKEHDLHHRPKAYSAKHTELGEDRIKEFKREWEQTVSECKKESPKLMGVANVYGSYDSIHSARFLLQNIDGKIIYQRIYHLLTGNIDQWTDGIIEEITWLGKNIKLSVIDKPLDVEYCPCCSQSLSNVLDKNVMIHLTTSDWQEKAMGSIYINPITPSLALTISYNTDLIFSSHLHKCNGHLHFQCDNYEERTPINKRPSVRSQATALISKVIETWEVKNILIGTGNPDDPFLIEDFDLPLIWEKGFIV